MICFEKDSKQQLMRSKKVENRAMLSFSFSALNGIDGGHYFINAIEVLFID